MKQMGLWVLACALLTAACLCRAGELPALRFELVAQVQERPVLVVHDGVNRSRNYVVEQPGRVMVVENGKMRATPYLDLSDRLVTQGECGLLGLAFHPKFTRNGYFYVNYTVENAGAPKVKVRFGNKTVEQTPIKTVIAEFKADPASGIVDVESQRVVMEIPQPYENHNGGMIAFGPDGMLYIIMGDGGNQRDPHRNGQNLGVLLAKMLRIDVSPREGYAVPKDNPFVGSAGARPEIWAYGLRNAWRFSFDRETGLLYAADVGEDRWEEVNIVRRGGNYGWSEREGGFAFNRQRPGKDERPPATMSDTPQGSGFIDPIKAYWHDQGLSITGGYVYRGKAIPRLRGWYVYGDYSKGTFWGLKYDQASAKVVGDETLRIVNEKEIRPILISGFGEDFDGEIYVCSHEDRKVWKIVAGE
jgi:glucose/arabinose dehydrogenase